MEEYTAPTLEVVGGVAELTLGGTVGQFLDADFPRGSNFDDLTFS